MVDARGSSKGRRSSASRSGMTRKNWALPKAVLATCARRYASSVSSLREITWIQFESGCAACAQLCARRSRGCGRNR